MAETHPTDPDNRPTTKAQLKARILSWLPYILLPLVVYFGNVEVQSYLGRQALAETGLAPLPLDQALLKAEQEGKRVLADMSAIWCATCRKLDREVLSDADVKRAIAKDYVFARVEYESEDGAAFMAKYQVRGFPTLLILSPEGRKLVQLPLTFSPTTFVELLTRS